MPAPRQPARTGQGVAKHLLQPQGLSRSVQLPMTRLIPQASSLRSTFTSLAALLEANVSSQPKGR